MELWHSWGQRFANGIVQIRQVTEDVKAMCQEWHDSVTWGKWASIVQSPNLLKWLFFVLLVSPGLVLVINSYHILLLNPCVVFSARWVLKYSSFKFNDSMKKMAFLCQTPSRFSPHTRVPWHTYTHIFKYGTHPLRVLAKFSRRWNLQQTQNAKCLQA